MTNQRNFNGQYFNTYEEGKGLNKTNSKQRYAKMQKYRYINQMKDFAHVESFYVHVTRTLTNVHVIFSGLVIVAALCHFSSAFTQILLRSL